MCIVRQCSNTPGNMRLCSLKQRSRPLELLLNLSSANTSSEKCPLQEPFRLQYICISLHLENVRLICTTPIYPAIKHFALHRQTNKWLPLVNHIVMARLSVGFHHKYRMRDNVS